MAETKITFCQICEATCGLRATVEQGTVVSLEPDDEHVVSKGYACVKGLRAHETNHSPDRLRYPLKRVGDGFVRISWGQALSEITAKLKQLRVDHGGDSVGFYLGNPISFNFFSPILAAGFVQGLGTKNFFQSGSQDCNNKFVVAQRMYGFPFVQPYPDIDRTRLLIVVGSNPAVSRMSFINLPDPMGRLKAIERRGGRVVFVNPRRIESAKQVGEHVFIRPDTDIYFYLAFLNEVLRRTRDELRADRRVGAHMKNQAVLERVAEGWTPERSAVVTGIEADALRSLVAAYLEADGAALFSSTGVNQGSNGTLTFWIQEAINAITGNLDRAGGTLVGHGLVPDLPRHLRKGRHAMREDRSRVGGLHSCVGSFPAGIMAEEILTPGPGQIRGMFVLSGNPLLSLPNNGDTLEDALSKLELLVCIDIFRSETTNLAHYILPGTTALQRPSIGFAFQSLMGVSPVPFVQYKDRVVPPEAEQRDEVEILLELARRARLPLFGSRVASLVFNTWRGLGKLPLLGGALGWSHERMLGGFLRLTGQKGLRHHREHPHGILREPWEAGDFLGERVVTDDGLVDLAPSDLVAMSEKLEGDYAQELEQRQRLKLVSKREPMSHNSWLHNNARFVKGRRRTNYLYMNPDDARARGLERGERVIVSSAVGEIELPLAITADMMKGAVALPHGWGHQKAKGLRVASQTEGANVNILAESGPEALEPLSGMAHMNGILVEVEASERSSRPAPKGSLGAGA